MAAERLWDVAGHRRRGSAKSEGRSAALLRQAIARFEQAAALDLQYALPHNNRAAWLLELADWQSSHGQSPVEAITTATAAAERAIALNPKNPLAYGNAGQAQIKLATWQRQAGLDGRVAAEQATGSCWHSSLLTLG